MLQGQEGARALARRVYAAAVYDGVRPREVDELEDALARGLPAVAAVALKAPVGDGDDLARLHVAQELCAYGVERAALAGDDPAAVYLAYAQRAEAYGVAHGYELARAHDREGIGALEAVHRAGDRLLDGAGAYALARDGVGDDLGVRGGAEDGAVELVALAQLGGVREVAVVREGHAALDVADDEGLGVLAALAAGGAVAAVGDGHAPLGQLAEHVLREDLADEARVRVAGDDAVVVHGDAAALLAAVLQGVERVVRDAQDVRALFPHVDAEYAALLVQLAENVCSHVSLPVI